MGPLPKDRQKPIYSPHPQKELLNIDHLTLRKFPTYFLTDCRLAAILAHLDHVTWEGDSTFGLEERLRALMLSAKCDSETVVPTLFYCPGANSSLNA